MTHSEMVVLIKGIEQASGIHRDQVPGDDVAGDIYRDLILKSGYSEFSISDFVTNENIRYAPTVVYEVNYYLARGGSDKPVSRVTLILSDYARKLKVEGSDQTSIDNVIGIVESKFRSYERRLGGSKIRGFVGLSLIAISLVAATIILSEIKTRNARLLNTVAVIALLSAAFLFFRLGSIFQGFTLYPDGFDFWTRNQAWMGVAGFLLAIATAVPVFAKFLYDGLARLSAAATAPMTVSPDTRSDTNHECAGED